MVLSFAKYQGAGNDFIVIDDRIAFFPAHDGAIIRRLCHRQKGIGADGVILLQESDKADFRMRIFNADGGEPSMCGNGIRCLVHYIRGLGFKSSSFKIETMHSVLACQAFDEKVGVFMGAPHIMHWGIEVLNMTAYVLDTGVPHAVIFVSDLDNLDVFNLGRAIRTHKLFAPNGVNVDFAAFPSHEGVVRVRTYERGVEAETLACGTGAAAVAYVAHVLFGLESLVPILTASGETLEIHREEKELLMIGPATPVFHGRIEINGDCV